MRGKREHWSRVELISGTLFVVLKQYIVCTDGVVFNLTNISMFRDMLELSIQSESRGKSTLSGVVVCETKISAILNAEMLLNFIYAFPFYAVLNATHPHL